jgi:hypothetical protein
LKWLAAGPNKLPAVPNGVTPERGIAIGVGIAVLTAGGLALARIAFVEAYGSAEMDDHGEKIGLPLDNIIDPSCRRQIGLLRPPVNDPPRNTDGASVF